MISPCNIPQTRVAPPRQEAHKVSVSEAFSHSWSWWNKARSYTWPGLINAWPRPTFMAQKPWFGTVMRGASTKNRCWRKVAGTYGGSASNIMGATQTVRLRPSCHRKCPTLLHAKRALIWWGGPAAKCQRLTYLTWGASTEQNSQRIGAKRGWLSETSAMQRPQVKQSLQSVCMCLCVCRDTSLGREVCVAS